MIYFAAVVLGVAFVAIASSGCGIGMGTCVSGALNAMSRQPELYGKFQIVMFIGLAFIESLTIYALVISFILLGRLPSTEEVMEIVKHAPK